MSSTFRERHVVYADPLTSRDPPLFRRFRFQHDAEEAAQRFANERTQIVMLKNSLLRYSNPNRIRAFYPQGVDNTKPAA